MGKGGKHIESKVMTALKSGAKRFVMSVPGVSSKNHDTVKVNAQLPHSGLGFGIYGWHGGQYGTHWTIAAIKDLGFKWYFMFPDTPVAVGNISKLNGADFSEDHQTHLSGFDVDFGAFPLPNTPAAKDTTVPLCYWEKDYSQSRTRSFFWLVYKLYPKSSILFNDPVLIGEGICIHSGGHDNHFHVSFVPND